MKATSQTTSPASSEAAVKPRVPFIFNECFEEPRAEKTYGGAAYNGTPHALGFMPDPITRECSQRMHYAGWRISRSTSTREANRWLKRYFAHRNDIVMGNNKLTFRAVRKWAPKAQFMDDMAADCQVVLIKAVAAYNPWLNIRFSTYAFTCLMRALSRLSQRQAGDRLWKSLPLQSLNGEESSYSPDTEAGAREITVLEEYLRDEHTLLTPREKFVLIRRYHLHDDGPNTETLEQVGRDLGLSKERVRQVQLSAIEKLRAAILAENPTIGTSTINVGLTTTLKKH
jgi:RNA polymerase sigma factor (sigma-70 family)